MTPPEPPPDIPENPDRENSGEQTPLQIPLAPIPLDPGWGILDILLIALFTLGALFLSGFVGLAIAPHFPAFHSVPRVEVADNPLVLIPIQAIAYLLAFFFTRILITLRAQQDFWFAIKWNLLPAGDMLTFVFAGVVLALTTQVLGHFLPIPKQLPMDKYFVQPSYIYLMMAFGILVAPLIEEIFFRGLIFPVAVRYLGLSFGTAVTALVFALIHQGQLAHAWAPLSLLFLVGFVLTGIRAMTRSVAASWITHLSYNTTLFVLLIYATGGLKHLERLNQ